jgi:septum site-determining protein MinC
MSAAPQAANEPFRLRGGNFNLLVLRLLDHRPEVVVPAIADQFRRAPGLLRNAPIVLGLADIAADPDGVDFAGILRGLRQAEINPIGTTGGSGGMRAAAQQAGLAPLRAAGEADAPAVEPDTPPAPPPPAPGTQRPTLVVEHAVRAGQRIWAEGADCIVLGAVNAGGEVIADGHLHVYGPLRGRAIAGGADNTDARIFAFQFEPELVSIAGFYATRDGLGSAPIGKPVQVRLRGEALSFDRLG